MNYTEFVKQEMPKLKDMPNSEKFKHISLKWREMKGIKQEPKIIDNVENDVLSILKQNKPKTTKKGVKKLVSAVKKLMPESKEDSSIEPMKNIELIHNVIKEHTHKLPPPQDNNDEFY